MHSMTGYGRGETTRDGVRIAVEIRTVNHRFRDVNVRCPRDYAPLESRISTHIGTHLARGRLEVRIRREIEGASTDVHVNVALAERYHDALSSLAQTMPGVSDQVPLSLLVGQPGVLTVTEPTVDSAQEWELLRDALDAALEAVLVMRKTEGAALEAACTRQVSSLERCHGRARELTAGVAVRMRARLQARLDALSTDGVEPSRLAQEVALLADRADVTEELDRLESHLAQFRTALQDDGPVGRRLEFLCQELNREINTTGSKASEPDLSSLVVEMKSSLERLREQVANVE